MCGLCGVLSTHLSQAEIDVFRDLMVLSTLRGADGAGVVAIPQKRKKDIRIVRSTTTAAELVHTTEFRSAARDTTMLMGHARYPTSGGFELPDVHPHVFENIIGMHNGTMSDVAGVPVSKADNDSSMLFRSIRDIGLEDTIKTSRGAYAITMVDKVLEQISFLRNEERTLYFGHIPLWNTMFWASEASFLQLVVPRKIVAEMKIVALRPDTLVSFSCRPGKIKPTDVSPLKPPEEKKTKTSVPVHALPPPSNSNNDPPLLQTKKGIWMPMSSLRSFLASGCSFCTQPQEMAEHTMGKLTWLESDEYVCHACATKNMDARAHIESVGLLPPAIPRT